MCAEVQSDLRLQNPLRPLESFRHWSENCQRRPMLEVVRDWRDFPARLHGGVLTIGNFDGVHRGHQVILNQLVRTARQRNCPSIVFTFSPHPIAILRPQQAPIPLSDFEYRGRLLGKFGIDVMVVCRTNPELLALEYHQFFAQVVRSAINPVSMIEGPNFYFGRNRKGTPERLAELCEQSKIDLQIVKPLEAEGEMVSSSVIRQLISAGEIAAANQSLGHCFELSGTVTTGDGRGRRIGVPTANLSDVGTLIPADGVYAGTSVIAGKSYPAAINVGAPLTFGQTDRRIEVHLVGFAGNLYGQRIRIQLREKVRDSRAFDSADELKQQIRSDIQSVVSIADGDQQDC